MKIPITISPIFWVMAFIIGWLSTETLQGSFIWMGIILLSVLVHEYGHALSAHYFGQKARIELIAFGGATTRYGKKISLGKEFLVVLCGPLAGLLLAVVSLALLLLLPQVQNNLILYVLKVLVEVNFFWTAVNLLPVHPLDGGKLFSLFLESIFGLKGAKASFFLSGVFGIVLAVLLISKGLFFAGILFLLFMFESFKAWKESKVIEEEDRNSEFQSLLREAEEAIFARNFSQAEVLLKELLRQCHQGLIYVKASSLLASLYASQGKMADSYLILKGIYKDLDGVQLKLFQQVAYSQHQWKEAILAGNESFSEFPSQETALINLFCHARLVEKEPVLGWLKTALKEGPLSKDLLLREDFDALRKDDQFFKTLQARLNP